MKNLVKYLKPYTIQLIVLTVFTYLQVQANLKLPDYTAQIINNGIMANDMQAIWKNGILMLGVTLIGGIFAVIVGYLAAKIATGFTKDVRNATFARVESFSLTEFNKFSTASLITRSTNDMQQIQMTLIMLLRMVLMAPFMAVGALHKAILPAPSLTWIIALATVAMLTMIGFLFTVALPKFKILQKLVDRLNLVTRENLTGLRVVRAFNNEKREEDKFEKANEDLTKLNLTVNRYMVIMQPAMMLIMNLATLAVVWYGGHLVEAGSLEIGNMMAFMQYAIQTIMSFLMISIIFIMIPRASVSAKRVGEILQTEPTIKDPEKPVRIPKNTTGIVEFKEVTFSYPGADLPVLSNISFTAEAGKTTAFIGSTGSGKSTLINLIPRFFDVSAGQILVDGIDIRDYELTDLYSQIGYVPQKGILFSGTVESNIKYGNPKATEKQVQIATKTAQATEFVDKLEKKYKDPIAQGGSNVSGGQKQRLSIARALAVEPKIYIFDDSFSALDFKTDAALRKALSKETSKKTTLIVGQRISTMMHADKIIVLNEGKIVGEGTHEELIKNNKVYQEIALSQLSDKELKSIKSIGKINPAEAI